MPRKTPDTSMNRPMMSEPDPAPAGESITDATNKEKEEKDKKDKKK